MKVIRLNEADAHTAEEVKRKFNDNPDENSKLQTLKGYLLNSCGLKSEAWDYLERLDKDLLFDWITAFKFEEAGRTGNEFIAALNYPGSGTWITETEDRFMKAYNAYAAGYLSKENLDDSPLFDPLLYKNDEQGVKQILSYWDQLYDRMSINDTLRDELLDIFYENSKNETHRRIRTLAEIQSKINSLKFEDRDSNRREKIQSTDDQDRETLKSLINKNDDLKSYARELLSNENSNL